MDNARVFNRIFELCEKEFSKNKDFSVPGNLISSNKKSNRRLSPVQSNSRPGWFRGGCFYLSLFFPVNV